MNAATPRLFSVPPLTPFTPCFKVFAFTADGPDIMTFRGRPGFCRFVANKHTSRFSTLGSPRVFHWVTQGFPLGHPRKTLRLPSVRRPASPDLGAAEGNSRGIPAIKCHDNLFFRSSAYSVDSGGPQQTRFWFVGVVLRLSKVFSR